MNILIIKHGAFGDFIQSVGAFRAIRAQHPSANITLITTKPWAKLANYMLENGQIFNDIRVDSRNKGIQGIKESWQLIRWIKQQKFDYVYDLQNTDRTALYFKLLNPKPHWNGAVKGCSHRHDTPQRLTLHTIDRLKEQLAVSGITEVPENDLDWLPETNTHNIKQPYALIVAGGAPHRDKKRWTIEGYSTLCNHLIEQGVTPVLLGTKADANQTQPIAATNPTIIDLTDKTDFTDIATLARKAALAVGNDTGPMHLISVAGCKTVVLYSYDSDPSRCGQKGKEVQYIRVEDLQTLQIAEVLDAIA